MFAVRMRGKLSLRDVRRPHGIADGVLENQRFLRAEDRSATTDIVLAAHSLAIGNTQKTEGSSTCHAQSSEPPQCAQEHRAACG